MVGSCGKKKLYQSASSPTCDDLASSDCIKSWVEKSIPSRARVRDLYTGNQNRELVKGVNLLRQIEKAKVDFSIISAGFGVVNENDTLPTYDCSFSSMKKSTIQQRAEMLQIPSNFEKLINSDYDLVYLALGKKYFLSLGDKWMNKSSVPMVGFDRKLSGERRLYIPCAHGIVSSFSQNGHKIHGVTGFKGDLLRILASHVLDQENSYRELLAWTQPVYLRNLVMKLGNLDTWH